MAWVPLGPACIPNGQLGYDSTGRGPVGGRVTCIALSPTDPDNTIFIGTANGGVWRSNDVGKTWTPLMDDKVSMSIGAMQFHPTQPNLLYVATGEGNRGGGYQGRMSGPVPHEERIGWISSTTAP